MEKQKMTYYHSNITVDGMGQAATQADAWKYAAWLEDRLSERYPEADIRITSRDWEAAIAHTDGDEDEMREEGNALFEDWLEAQSRAEAARALGSIRSEAKAATSRENGARGGRPAKMIYRVDVDIMESKKFSSKHAAAEYARGFDWIATIFKLDETRDDWYIIGTKLRYAKKITWQEGFLSQPQD